MWNAILLKLKLAIASSVLGIVYMYRYTADKAYYFSLSLLDTGSYLVYSKRKAVRVYAMYP